MSGEYVPTTEDVRNAMYFAYVYADDAGAMFDRWLAAHDAAIRAEVEGFLSTVHGLNEMTVVRGIRKTLAGEHTTFQHECRLSVYGAPCGHEVPAHYPKGYGKCEDCRITEGRA